MINKPILVFSFLLLFSSLSRASVDNVSYVVIENMEVVGNKKTKAKVIFREMTIQKGDTILVHDLMNQIQLSQLNVYNLALFKDVRVNISNWVEDKVTIEIDLIERWYYVPVPIFKLTDRNFNVWIRDFNADFSRTIYGLFYSQDNVTGNNDLMRIGFYLGYSQAVSLMYNFPHINKKQTLGIDGFFRFDRNKEFPYKTEQNKQLFYKDDEFSQKSFNTGMVLRYRKEVYDEQFFGLFYKYTVVGDTILELNPAYFTNENTQQRYFQFNYRYESDHRNIRAYPTRGYLWSVEVEKMGLGIFKDVDYFNIYGAYMHFFDLGNKFYAASLIKAKLSAPGEQPYYNQRGIGYEQDFVRGYDVYVVDGQEYVFSRADIKYNFLNFNINNPLAKDVRNGKMPFRFYVKTFLDLGYVVDRYFEENNPHNNSLLVGGGIGIDMTALYGNVFRLEYSINKSNGLGHPKVENGLYLHFVMDIDDDMRMLKKARTLDPK